MNEFAPYVREIVLVGGGHSHVQVLKRFGMKPIPGVRLTLIAREPHTPYSGMLPGYVAGDYSWDEIHIDLARLANFAGARFVAGEVNGLQTEEQRVLVCNRPSIRYDVLSINSGGSPGTAFSSNPNVIPVKPIGKFLPQWQSVVARYKEEVGVKLAIVGGGAGSVELAVAIAERYKRNFQISLYTAASDLLIQHGRRARQLAADQLAQAGVSVVADFEVGEVGYDHIQSIDDNRVRADVVLWVTGVEAPDWLARSGLAVDSHGFVRVRGSLQSVSHDNIFAAGDVAELDGQSRPKSGVYAVREGPYLGANLKRYVLKKSLRRYKAQKKALALLRIGEGFVLGVRGMASLKFKFLRIFKESIDRRFVRRFQDLPEMPVSIESLPLPLREGAPSSMRCGGCGAKLGADLLERVMRRLELPESPHVIHGVGDDAALIDMGSSAIVTSCDSFRAMISDPYLFGRIAAHHALNDLFAMGAKPRIALALATIPAMSDEMMEEDFFQTMSGALSVFREHDVNLVGGHSAEGAELSLGFSVTGAAPQQPLLKKGMAVGDQLILTKPIGTGVILAASMIGKASAKNLLRALDSMDLSNAKAATTLRKYSASSCTDVTGFGLVGHLSEMIRASNTRAFLISQNIPVFEGAIELLGSGLSSSLQSNNEKALADFDINGGSAASQLVRVLADPQTAGGLLASVPPSFAKDCVEELVAEGYPYAGIIGEVIDGGSSRIVLDNPR